MKDRDFFLLSCLVTLTLISANFQAFLKSLATSTLVNTQFQQVIQQLKPEGFRKQEQLFWSRLKEVDLDAMNARSEVASVPQNPTPAASPKPSPSPKATPSKTSPKKSVAVPKKTPIKPFTRFLLVGDSTMFDLGVKLQSSLKKNYKISQTKLDYKPSTGLNRIDYFDWYARTERMIRDYNPDVLIILFGGNENQDIIDSQGKYRSRNSQEWQKAYQERVEKYAKLVSKTSVRKVYWVGQPMSNKPRMQKFFSTLNTIYDRVSQSYPKIKFVSTWETFSVGGKFVAAVADQSGKKRYVKVNDGVHFTSHGAKILSDVVIQKMLADQVLKPLR